MIGGMHQAVNLRGFDYYKTLFEYVKNTSTVNQEESTYFKDYQNYLMILEKLQKE